MNIPETRATLLKQQQLMLSGARIAQMFPTGTAPLDLPQGMRAVVTARGVFHYNPKCIDADRINAVSAAACENEILDLGPYSKPQIFKRVLSGEIAAAVSEYVDGVEIRTAAGTTQTLPEQLKYFFRTRQPDGCLRAGPQQPFIVAQERRGQRC